MVTLRLKPPLLVQVMVVVAPGASVVPLGDTAVMVSSEPLLSLSRNQPMSRICWRVRSRSSGRPTLIDGSISRFGVAEVFQCETDEPPWNGLGVNSSTRPLASRAALRKPEAMRTLAPSQSTLPGLIDEAARWASVIWVHSRPTLRSNW